MEREEQKATETTEKEESWKEKIVINKATETTEGTEKEEDYEKKTRKI